MKLKPLLLLAILLPIFPALAQSDEVTMSLYPYGKILQKGGTLKVLLVVGYPGNESRCVNLSAYYLPAGTSAWFEPQSGATNFTSILTIIASEDAIPGNYSIVIRAATNETVSEKEFSFTITSRTDFELEPQEPRVEVGVGGFTVTNVSVRSILGYKNWVKLYTTDLPSGLSIKFETEGGIPDYDSRVSIAAKESLSPGLYVIPIRGVGAVGVVHTVYLALTVVPESTLVMNAHPEDAGATEPALGPHSCRSGAKVKIEAFPKEGWRFDHWVVNGYVLGCENPTTIRVSGLTNVTAYFEEIQQAFELTLEPPSVSVRRGGSVSVKVVVSPGKNFTGFVSLSVEGLPPGVGCTLSKYGGYGGFESTINLTTSSTTPLGVHRINVIGSSENFTESVSLELMVYSAPPQFVVSASPSVITIQNGGSGEFRVSVVSLYGYNGTVSLYNPVLPSGLHASFDKKAGIPTFYSTLTLNASSVPPGDYYLSIIGSDGSMSRGCRVLVRITSSSATSQGTPP